MLIEPAELAKKLKEPSRRVLDTRPKADYAAGHVPGAAQVEVQDWQAQGKKEDGFRDAKAWGEIVGQLGIRRDSDVVVYGSNLTDTARVWWTLKYLGVSKVAILDGGWKAWAQDKLPATAEIPKIDAVRFEPAFQADRLEEIESLKKAVRAGTATVVDARSAGEFTGKDVRATRGGRLPGAKHLEWKELVSDDGRFKTPDQLRALFRERGIDPDQAAVTC